MTVAEQIAGILAGAGVRFVFGVPGGPSIPYMEAFRKAGMEFILTSHESAAGTMASVTGRLTGIPGVCHSTFGPGAVNLASGAGGALLDRSPVIILTSEMDDNMIGRTAQMNIDHQKLFQPLTKATFRVNPGNAAGILLKALDICREEYPGPVHIGLPSDIACLEAAEPGSYTDESEKKDHLNDTGKINALLENCRKPLIAAGLTSARFALGERLSEFLRHTKIPVVLTPMAKGLLPEDHPCYAGVLFHALSNYIGDILDDIDLVIGLGYDPVEYNYESWMPDVPLIDFTATDTDLPAVKRLTRFTGTPGEWFAILEQLQSGQLIFNQMKIDSVRNETISVFNGLTDHFGPVTALRVLREEIPADSIVTFDVGSHLHLAGQYWNTFGRQNMIMTNGWSGMGFGLPAALAAGISSPGSVIVCVTGDGGFLMNAGEIITARRYNLPVITVVLSDGELNLIKIKQSWQDLPQYATKLYADDLFSAEMFFGIRILYADSEESMKSAINMALSMKKPVIINARIDPDDYKWLVVRK
ncbi:MAG: thiamine pyrophosphate-binding protein [Bacteroidales bacterium]|jgi:acetolactate synthase-1/2/3 large subunit|nr:thiamine pyrophosphate-binding protein [Bacteroidales bacterium]